MREVRKCGSVMDRFAPRPDVEVTPETIRVENLMVLPASTVTVRIRTGSVDTRLPTTAG